MSTRCIRVLLVDDHRTMLWGLERLIQGRSPAMIVAGTAENPEEALEKIASLRPDVVLLDLDLAGRSSLDILPQITRDDACRVLVLTAWRDDATLDSVMLKGARGVLHKTANAELVLKAIEKVHAGELWVDHERLGRLFMGMTTPGTVHAPDPELLRLGTLTERERKIVQTLVDESGASNKAVAARLFISEHTLRNHLTSIYQKLDVTNRLELYVFAARHVAKHGPVAKVKPAAAGLSRESGLRPW